MIKLNPEDVTQGSILLPGHEIGYRLIENLVMIKHLSLSYELDNYLATRLKPRTFLTGET